MNPANMAHITSLRPHQDSEFWYSFDKRTQWITVYGSFFRIFTLCLSLERFPKTAQLQFRLEPKSFGLVVATNIDFQGKHVTFKRTIKEQFRYNFQLIRGEFLALTLIKSVLLLWDIRLFRMSPKQNSLQFWNDETVQ